jgi:hypothetical protein
MSQKSSLPQPIQSVSRVLTADRSMPWQSGSNSASFTLRWWEKVLVLCFSHLQADTPEICSFEPMAALAGMLPLQGWTKNEGHKLVLM